MEKYCPVNRYNLDDTMLEKVFDVLAQIHNMPIPEFLPKMNASALWLEKNEINQYLSGWCDVIREHGDVFSESDLIRIGETINTINKLAYTPKKMYCRFSTADITHDEISMQMSLANLNTSFIHWHSYLRGCSIERVRGIWNKMIEHAEYLYSVCCIR